jgi:hypothetical protein
LLCDIDTIIQLTCVMPMLETLQVWASMLRTKKTFICDFVKNVKLCQVDLHNIYYDEEKKYNYIDFL